MTILAWDGKVLAADTRASQGAYLSRNSVLKINRMPEGTMFQHQRVNGGKPLKVHWGSHAGSYNQGSLIFGYMEKVLKKFNDHKKKTLSDPKLTKEQREEAEKQIWNISVFFDKHNLQLNQDPKLMLFLLENGDVVTYTSKFHEARWKITHFDAQTCIKEKDMFVWGSGAAFVEHAGEMLCDYDAKLAVKAAIANPALSCCSGWLTWVEPKGTKINLDSAEYTLDELNRIEKTGRSVYEEIRKNYSLHKEPEPSTEMEYEEGIQPKSEPDKAIKEPSKPKDKKAA